MTQTLLISGDRFIADSGKLDTDKRYLFKLGDQNQFYLPVGQTIALNDYGLFRYSVGNVVWQTSNASHPVNFDAVYQAWGIGGVTGVPAVQSPPVTSDITAVITTGETGIINLANYITGSYFSIGIITAPTQGTIQWVDSQQRILSYNTSAPAGTTDSFTFQAYGPGGPSNISTVNITVEASQAAAPVCSDYSALIMESSTVSQFDISSAISGLRDSIYVVSQPLYGTVTNSGSSFTYTANSPATTGFQDSFTYQASYQGNASNIATITITETSSPPPPG